MKEKNAKRNAKRRKRRKRKSVKRRRRRRESARKRGNASGKEIATGNENEIDAGGGVTPTVDTPAERQTVAGAVHERGGGRPGVKTAKGSAAGTFHSFRNNQAFICNMFICNL